MAPSSAAYDVYKSQVTNDPYKPPLFTDHGVGMVLSSASLDFAQVFFGSEPGFHGIDIVRHDGSHRKISIVLSTPV